MNFEVVNIFRNSKTTAALGNLMRNWRNSEEHRALRVLVLLTHEGCCACFINYKTVDNKIKDKFITALRDLITECDKGLDADPD